MFPGAKIVAVDDEPKELEAIVSALRSLGLACVAYNYPNDLLNSDTPFTGLRVIFLDINLVGGASPGSLSSILSAPIRMLTHLVTDTNGPYALITWSSTTHHDELITRISKTKALANRQPFYSCALSKELIEEPESLKAEVERIFTEHPPFGALLDWERRVSQAGEAVLRDIYTLSEAFQGSLPRDKMDHLLSCLAVVSFGRANAADHRFEAVNESLLAILDDALKDQFFSEPPGKIWGKAITKCDDKTKLQEDTKAKLNSAVLLELMPGIKAYRRGAVLEIPNAWLADREFKRKFGASSENVARVLELPADFQPKWVLIQIQAACDFAQPKLAPIPYLLATTVPATVKDSKMPGYVSLTPAFAPAAGLSTGNFKLAIYHGTTHPIARSTLKRSGFVVLGRLREHLLESIVHTHHSHGSRPGFISFR